MSGAHSEMTHPTPELVLCSAQVAEVIRGVLTTDKPHLRHITSKQAKQLAQAKYADVKGDKTLAAIWDFLQQVR